MKVTEVPSGPWDALLTHHWLTPGVPGPRPAASIKLSSLKAQCRHLNLTYSTRNRTAYLDALTHTALSSSRISSRLARITVSPVSPYHHTTTTP